MAEKKTVSANPLTVEFPRDQYQLTQKLKSEALRAAGRVGTQKDKLEVYLETLDVLRAHAIERFKKAKGIEASSVEAAKVRAAREAEAATKAQEARTRQATAELASALGVGLDKLEVTVKEAE